MGHVRAHMLLRHRQTRISFLLLGMLCMLCARGKRKIKAQADEDKKHEQKDATREAKRCLGPIGCHLQMGQRLVFDCHYLRGRGTETHADNPMALSLTRRACCNARPTDHEGLLAPFVRRSYSVSLTREGSPSVVVPTKMHQTVLVRNRGRGQCSWHCTATVDEGAGGAVGTGNDSHTLRIPQNARGQLKGTHRDPPLLMHTRSK